MNTNMFAYNNLQHISSTHSAPQMSTQSTTQSSNAIYFSDLSDSVVLSLNDKRMSFDLPWDETTKLPLDIYTTNKHNLQYITDDEINDLASSIEEQHAKQ